MLEDEGFDAHRDAKCSTSAARFERTWSPRRAGVRILASSQDGRGDMRGRAIVTGGIAAGLVYGARRWVAGRPGRPKRPPHPATRALPEARLETVHEFFGPIPTGVTVSRGGRTFVCHPRWEDPVEFTVGELRDGVERPYPSAAANDASSSDGLFSVQSVVVDPHDRLWALDTGSVNMGPIKGRDWPKLVCVDLATDRIVNTIRFPADVALDTTYLNDVRFDLRGGAAGLAFITDSSSEGPNAIVVVDLATGRSWRKLHDHAAVKGDRTFVALLEGKPVVLNPPRGLPRPALVGADGISLEATGTRLWFCPLASRSLYSVSLAALADPDLPDAAVAATLVKERRRFASDGLEADAEGNLYLTDWEHNAIVVRRPDGRYETLVADRRMWWPDTLSLADDGFLYFTANQLHRLPKFHRGKDLRERPMFLFRVRVGATPVRLAG
jgi:sugar lactone lactonase YvrE